MLRKHLDIIFPLYQIESDGFMYFILYDEHMKPIPSVYQYLNFRMKESPLTSRSKAAFAIRLLYCFLSLSGYRVNRIDEKAFRELLFFLRGINTNPKQYSMKTQRKSSDNSHRKNNVTILPTHIRDKAICCY